MVTREEVQEARERYAKLQKMWDEQSRPMEWLEVRKHLGAIQEQLDRIMTFCIKADSQLANECGITEDIPF